MFEFVVTRMTISLVILVYLSTFIWLVVLEVVVVVMIGSLCDIWLDLWPPLVSLYPCDSQLYEGSRGEVSLVVKVLT